MSQVRMNTGGTLDLFTLFERINNKFKVLHAPDINSFKVKFLLILRSVYYFWDVIQMLQLH